MCSRHFHDEDYTEATASRLATAATAVRKRLKVGAVPSRFEWNGWSGISRPGSVYTKESEREEVQDMKEHDSAPQPGNVMHECVCGVQYK